MELALRGLTRKTCLVYLNDVMVEGRNFEELLKNQQEVFNKFPAANWKLNLKNCALFQKKVEFWAVRFQWSETRQTKIRLRQFAIGLVIRTSMK